MKQSKRTTRAEIIEKLGFTEGQVKHSIKSLKKEKYIESKGLGRNTYYVFAEN